MSVKSLEELAAGLPEGSVLAGLDLGTKTIGIAISDLGLSLATPRDVLRRTRFTKDAEKLLEILKAERVGGCIIGLPVNMDGSQGPRAQATRAFVRNLETKTDLDFAFWDERLSTVAAERALLEMDVSRKKRAQRIDAAAAAFILQGALDRLSSLSTGSSG
ncbi:Holliday junction resolvase RuvX [Hoeflea poritis]|uniref:Putative pre-16S rRNA nuclease n=1 Tax=Hoeflea poritis TaxID=2993659 RepID=A0ABT4VPY5_9HYPH|nr:Holliday junction resolvase RuvX [Hoeflea poritis]MDA4846768.1 Holliday junction resolvase RuvX [Hoeflea poritis]